MSRFEHALNELHESLSVAELVQFALEACVTGDRQAYAATSLRVAIQRFHGAVEEIEQAA